MCPALHVCRRISRQFSTLTPSLALAQREYRGDPGPSSRKSQESRVRSSLRSGRDSGRQSTTLNDRGVLDALLDRSTRDAPRQRPFREERLIPSQGRAPRSVTPAQRGRIRPRFDPTSQGFYTPRSLPQKGADKLQPNPYDTSRQLRAWINAHPPPINHSSLKEAIGIVMGAEKGAVNAVVWNALLGLVGRQGGMERMWKLYNDMKKTGIVPNSRTYATLINAHAGANHAQDLSRFSSYQSVESRSFQRITTIYNQSQTHIIECLGAVERRKASGHDVGLAGDENLSAEDAEMEEDGNEQEVSLGPTNAYLKLLGKYGRWQEMDRIYVAMDREGPLAPDTVTYSLMFSSLLNRSQQQKTGSTSPVAASRPGEAKTSMSKPSDIGPAASTMWDRAVRQYHSPNAGHGTGTGTKRIDNELALLALQCLLAGRPADRRLATALIPFLWNLPAPGSTIVASSERSAPRANMSEIPQYMQLFPALTLDSRTGKTLLSMLGRTNHLSLAAYYAEHLLDSPQLLNIIDWGVLQACIHMLSNTGKVDRIVDILDSFQPPTGEDGWPRHVWWNALTAARWSAKFPAALTIFRRMTHLPNGIEDNRPNRYTWAAPNQKPVDSQGRRWIPPRPMPPDAKSISLFLKTAIGANSLRAARQAWTVFCHYPLQTFFVIPRNETKGREVSLLPPFEDGPAEVSPGLAVAAEWRVILARDVEGIAERILEAVMSGEEVKRVNETRRMMSEIAKVWGAKLGTVKGGDRMPGEEQEVGLEEEGTEKQEEEGEGTRRQVRDDRGTGLSRIPHR